MESKRDKIIEEARNLFTQYGFKKVSMDEIAKHANVSKVTIYSYFKNKEELLNYLIEEKLDKIKTIIERESKQKGTFFEKLHNTLYEMLKYKNEQRLLLKIAQENEFLNNNILKNTLTKIDNKINTYIKEKLDVAVKNKEIRPCNTKLIAFLLYSSYASLLIRYDEFSEELTKTELQNNLITFLEKGLEMKGEEK